MISPHSRAVTDPCERESFLLVEMMMMMLFLSYVRETYGGLESAAAWAHCEEKRRERKGERSSQNSIKAELVCAIIITLAKVRLIRLIKIPN